MSVIVFIPQNASQSGIIAQVTQLVSQKGLSIRQALAEDPETNGYAKLILILEGEIVPELINDIRKLPGTHSVTVY